MKIWWNKNASLTNFGGKESQQMPPRLPRWQRSTMCIARAGLYWQEKLTIIPLRQGYSSSF